MPLGSLFICTQLTLAKKRWAMIFYTARRGLPFVAFEGLLRMRKRLSTLSIWLGLFAMLMIHAGPLYSALQMAQASAGLEEHDPHSGHTHVTDASSSHHGHHQQSANQPEWLAALEMCGYCELLTLNPPLALSLHLVLSQHQPVPGQTLPETPLKQLLRHSGSHARAPPVPFHS